MENLRIIDVQVIDSSNIEVKFSHNLTSNLVTSNIKIIADTPNVPDSEVLEIKVVKDGLSINCQPLTPLAAYFLEFKSIALHPFTSVNGDAIIIEDGISNKYLITGPLEPDNAVQNYLINFLREGVYNLEDSNTLVNKYIKSLAVVLSKALYDIGQVKNENYLSFNINDELKTRGAGPFDRLEEEGAYEIVRVGRTPSNSTATTTFNFSNFPSYPITLQRNVVLENLQVDSSDEVGKFNINNLILNLNNTPVTKLNSLVFTLATSNPVYTYDISKFGYQIKDSRYDSEFGFTFVSLLENQIKISDKILEDPNFSLDKILQITVQYEAKNLGRVVNENTVEVYTVENAIREVLPPIINIFNLEHAPIVNSNGETMSLDGITFTDPNSNTGSKHPAFLYELPFRLNALPATPGQYSIDYSSGTVYVFGENNQNDGTGPFPPLATYKYKFVYKSDQDYTYDPSLTDIVALPKGSLLNFEGRVSFDYEEVLVPGVDYIAGLHQEELFERIDNRLLALNVLKTKNSPITNVFRIYNETSGEIYSLNRWSDDKVYFKYNTPPRILSQINERAAFQTESNELLFVSTTLTNIGSIRIFKILLDNNHIIASTEDSTGASFNTSISFSNTNIFQTEKWFNREFTEISNINRLQNVGEYIIDYINGILYCAVSSAQDFNIGTITYKKNSITPLFPHLISVEDIYYRSSVLEQKNKQFAYLSFDDGQIVPEVLDYSDELFLNNNDSAPYQVFNTNVGAFVDSTFVNGVTNKVKFVRNIFEYDDLLNSNKPFNFAFYSTFSGFNIKINPVSKQVFDAVKFDGSNYYVLVNENISYLSPNITYNFSVIRNSDSAQLWNSSGTIITGDPVKLILPGINSPNIGDLVTITYDISVNNLSRVVVDYNKGDYFVDYTYLADEIIVSYEYGDNVLDFRTSKTVPTDTTYYVTYKAGALRDALLKNFGTLVNIPELSNFDVNFNRERYRDALIAALSSFIQGPTVTAMKNIGKVISHIEPEIIESIFQNWSLGNSLLVPQNISTTGSFQLLPSKFGNGVLVDNANQTITTPVSSSFRLEEGAYENWISPQWNGIDNDAQLTFNILKDGYVLNSSNIFIGFSEYHPTLILDSFSIDKLAVVAGTPNKNKDGIYIYYDKDLSGSFSRWYVDIVDGYADGYIDGYNTNAFNYKIKINTNGTVYDVKSITTPKPTGITLFSGTNTISFNLKNQGQINYSFTFIADLNHYLLDFGQEENKNRLSLYKDASGYLNFKVYDREKDIYTISSDISHWKAGDLHHIAISWKLNTYNSRDEMHLFIDGFEVPNIIKYGQSFAPYLHEKFRAISSEEILGLADRDIISSTDLVTTSGSNVVSSSINFSAYNIFAGDTIYIDETGFNVSGYTIVNVSGQLLTLNSAMPLTLSNGRFSINRTNYTVSSDIDVASNIAISTIHVFISGSDLNTTANSNSVSSSTTNFTNQNVLPGYLLRINSSGLEITYTILQVLGNTLVIDSNLPNTLSGLEFFVYSREENEIPGIRALRPSYSISNDSNFNNVLTISNNVEADDLVLIRTLGLNNKKVKKQYYVWTTNKENILMTRLPPPISLDEAKITKIILPPLAVGPNNSVVSSGSFYMNGVSTAQPSNSQNGRTISIILRGTNVDFSTPAQITINGVSGMAPVSETISFSDYGALDSANKYTSINFINIVIKPININRAAGTIELREKFPITYAEVSGLAPVIRFSYHVGGGYNLFSDGPNSVRDEGHTFSALHINNYLLIHQPPSVAGFYKITGLSEDRKSLTLASAVAGPIIPPITSFTGGVYQILNVNEYRSGLQNGFFTLEAKELPSQPYLLTQGFYEVDYFTYARIKLDPLNVKAFIGSDFNSNNQINATIDQVKIHSVMLTDIRVGESIPSNQKSITKDFNSLKALKKDSTTLMLINFDAFPFTNEADFYKNINEYKKYFQSSLSVNENFQNSIAILNEPIVLSNDGILDTRKEGSIEFWVHHIYDTANDPQNRFYFDAYGAVIEEAISVDNVSVKLSSLASQILSVTLQGGDPNIDYFAGGKLEIETQNDIFEEGTSISNNSVMVSKAIFQVISVKIDGDLTGTDYFGEGTLSSDRKTIYLGKLLPSNGLPLLITYKPIENSNNKLNSQIIRLNRRLPAQNSHVIVKYIPKGLQGDRLSIFKDIFGYINFAISASGIDYVVRAPTRWARDTWHRVKVSYKLNGGLGTDEMRLFLDGYEYSNVTFGSGPVFGPYPIVMGSSMPGDDGYKLISNINFKDPINELFIGSQYTKENPIFALIDNFRISNISRPIYAPYGESIDVNYNSNLSAAFPVTEDLYTTYLLDFNTTNQLNEDFAVIQNRNTGAFDFSINIFDSFGFVGENTKVQEALEKLIKVLKPANSKVLISYVK